MMRRNKIRNMRSNTGQLSMLHEFANSAWQNKNLLRHISINKPYQSIQKVNKKYAVNSVLKKTYRFDAQQRQLRVAIVDFIREPLSIAQINFLLLCPTILLELKVASF